MYYVGKFDESRFAVPHGYARNSRGYDRADLVDHGAGSVHMGAGICQLQPPGNVDSRIHDNEKGIYVLEGELEIKRGREVFRLSADDYALIPYGMPHALRNTGTKPARWFEMQAPQPKPPGGWQDTFFTGDNDWPAQVSPPDFTSATTRSVGRFKPQNPMALKGKGTSGLSVYRFMEQKFGAQGFFMMRGELSVDGARSRHDHTVEEFYFALSGEAFMDIENERFHLRRGDVAWTGVGASHAFCHTGSETFRWIETQAPQFPAKNGTRDYADWDKLRTDPSP
ncbi:MAG: cupin domain-containing protein [Betaproteobacteria bacterium]|nr:cupin domain-containing protein [Betaproteobacteria bacterium]